ETHVLAHGRHGLERLGRDREPVADAAALDHDVVGPPDHHAPSHRGDHASAFVRAAALAWQMATARASAAWSGSGGVGSLSSAPTMRCTWPFSARPLPHTAFF